MSEEELAKALCTADAIWNAGEAGVMAASPEIVESVVESLWKVDSAQRRYRYLAQAVMREMAKS